MSEQQVTVILVSYNSRAVIGTALTSIPQGIPTIVVDNASSDGTPAYIRENFPAVEVIVNEKNIGFGSANNLALEKITTPFALLMNPDACFTDLSTIDGLLAAGERYPEAAILAPEIVDENGVRQVTLPAPLIYRKEINRRKSFSMDSVTGDVCAFSLSGALMLLRMSAFDDVAYFFDPMIFMYYEDDDICMGLRQRDYSCVLIPSLVVSHIAGTSSPPSLEVELLKQENKFFSQLYVTAKYYDPLWSVAKARRALIKGWVVGPILSLLGSSKRLKLTKARSRAASLFLELNSKSE